MNWFRQWKLISPLWKLPEINIQFRLDIMFNNQLELGKEFLKHAAFIPVPLLYCMWIFIACLCIVSWNKIHVCLN